MRWVVAGAGGMLGTDLVALLVARGDDVVPVDRSRVDLLDPAACVDAARGADVVVNCAAYTAVDQAETAEAEAFTANAVVAAHLARAAHRVGARMVQVSTDYVFDGAASTPYPEDAPVAPRSAYGRTKAAGEWAVRAEAPDHLVVRTAWLYGAHGSCFPRTIVRVARERGGLDVVTDQTGQPTWTVDLADLVARLVDADAPAGTYHGTAGGAASWLDLARAAVSSAGMDPAIVRPTTSAAYVRPAPRPAWSVLGHERFAAAGVAPIGPWAERWAEASGPVLAGL